MLVAAALVSVSVLAAAASTFASRALSQKVEAAMTHLAQTDATRIFAAQPVVVLGLAVVLGLIVLALRTTDQSQRYPSVPVLVLAATLIGAAGGGTIGVVWNLIRGAREMKG